MSEPKPLVRMTLGGSNSLPGFVNERNYSYICNVEFVSCERGGSFYVYNLGKRIEIVLEGGVQYKPTEAEEFLRIVEKYLNERGWYLCYTQRSTTMFSGYQKIEGELYSHKEFIEEQIAQEVNY